MRNFEAKASGNAADAEAILLGICEPPMTGIGGGGFVPIKQAAEEQGGGAERIGSGAHRAFRARMRDCGLTDVPLCWIEIFTLPGTMGAFCRLSADGSGSG